VLAPHAEVEAAILAARRSRMLDLAEASVAAAESCRGWSEPNLMRRGLTAGATLLTLLLLVPVAVLAALTLLAVAVLVANTALKAAATIASLRRPARAPGMDFALRPAPRLPPHLPLVSILVPLYREREIAGRLVLRLQRLSYPRDRREICLALEEDDFITRRALALASLPDWMHVIEVPRGAVKTKPRALNYGLSFCRGDIVGIYDAEDAPEPDQIERVVARFAEAPPQVVCLQGVLDFYNPQQNWLARAFTIEYATWFRLVLPGLERLGLAVPLGGTTLFFRRRALLDLGRWDAHNVTEDADLGLRLARHGFRTELIATLTEEEANCQPVAWVRQRSRWLKGYAMTGFCHLRDPRALHRDLGTWRFLGAVALLLGTVLHYLLAPLLWSFWIELAGLHHPLERFFGPSTMLAAGAIFALTEATNLAIGIVGLSRSHHRGLAWWVPTMHLYFPLGTFAAWKGVAEIALRPYYWDKTAHGFSPPNRIDRPASVFRKRRRRRSG
jgi:cellulose synthase/poly-beta-1,6-N-acetylglucosamine synthase-like glycosyltransferase